MGKISFGWTLPNGPGSVERRAEFVADVERGLERISGHFERRVLPAVNAGGTNS
jgi:hypothetical protein